MNWRCQLLIFMINFVMMADVSMEHCHGGNDVKSIRKLRISIGNENSIDVLIAKLFSLLFCVMSMHVCVSCSMCSCHYST